MKKPRDFPVVMPPQTFYSPSEQKGFLLRQMPRTMQFGCALMVLVLLVFVAYFTLTQFLVPSWRLPISGAAIVFFALSICSFVMAFLHQRDLEQGNPAPRIRDVPPWGYLVLGLGIGFFGIVSVFSL